MSRTAIPDNTIRKTSTYLFHGTKYERYPGFIPEKKTALSCRLINISDDESGSADLCRLGSVYWSGIRVTHSPSKPLSANRK